MEILAAYVRNNAKINYSKKEILIEQKEDIQSILTIIGRRNWKYDREGQVIDLSNTNLKKYKFRGFFKSINLFKVQLQGSDLTKVNLKEADLRESNLKEANLMGANLQGALFWGKTSLENTNLAGVNLQDADLVGTNLEEANLFQANLKNANLWTANLKDIRGWENITNIKNANILNIKNPPKGFTEFAKKNGAIAKAILKKNKKN